MVVPNRRDHRFDRCPDCIYHFGFERAHDDGALHCVVVCWVALGIKPEPTRRPVDGHLPARPLSAVGDGTAATCSPHTDYLTTSRDPPRVVDIVPQNNVP